MKTLITGNMGYVGSALSKYLRTTRPDAVLHGRDRPVGRNLERSDG